VTPRTLALLLVAVAVLLHAGVTLPAAARARAAGEAYARLRGERREAQARLASVELRQEARSRALAAIAVPAPAPDEAAARLRAALSDALEGQPLSGVRLSVRPGRSPVTAFARVLAKGSFRDVMALSARLLAPPTGLIIEDARFGPGLDGVDVELALASIGGPR
jgi:hypothetical protein